MSSYPKINLHIHSNYSDGKNTINQIIKRSLELDLEYIAITDHFTNSWKSWVSKLNNHENISNYLQELSSSQRNLVKNNNCLTLLKGIELDLSSTEDFIRNYVQIDRYDIILFEYLQSYEVVAFLKNILHFWKKSLSNSNVFPILGLAHFDPSYFISGNLDPLMKFLKEYSIYFEFNSSYPSFYSLRYRSFFEKLEEYLVPVAIGSDSHSLANLNDIEEPYEIIKYYNLEKNLNLLLETLKFKKLV